MWVPPYQNSDGKYIRNMSSPVMKVLWAGWEISMNQDINRDCLQIAVKHPKLQIYGLGNIDNSFRYEGPGNIHSTYSYLENYPITINWMSFKLEIHMQSYGYEFDRFTPVNTKPVYENYEIKDIQDFRLFTPIDTGKEIIVMKKNVPIMLKEILKYQEPKQAELRENKRKEIRQLLRNAPGVKLEHRMNTLKVEDEQVASLIAV